MASSRVDSPAGSPALLPWYNFPTTRPVLDSVWFHVRGLLSAAGYANLPTTLDHHSPYPQLITLPHLTLGQCCGLDLFHPPLDEVIPIAAPNITNLDSAAGTYYSYIVRKEATKLPSRLAVAVNAYRSHSGYTALLAWLRAEGMENFTVTLSGSHAESVSLLQEGVCDLAAIDALSWNYLNTRELYRVGKSAPALAPPFVVGPNSPVPNDMMLAALDEAFTKFGQPLGITGALPIAKKDYVEMFALYNELVS